MTPTIDYLMTLYEHNNILIERLMRSNEEIQRSIINMNTPVYTHTNITRRNARYENDIRNALFRVMRPRQPMRMNNDFLDPVSVFPSRQQIENACRRTRYGDIVRPVNTSCPISLDTFTDDDNVIMIRYCGHIFKLNEFNSWFGSHSRCPVCRYDIRENILDVSGVANPNIDPSARPISIANPNIDPSARPISIANPNIDPSARPISIANASLNTSTTRNATATTRNVLNSLINNTQVSENDVYDMLNLLLDPSSNYVSLRFDIVD
uniref:RING-type domain-containing protein n=1 Tax=viral metagenome TaxID=1070528 RepID=A0A6C0E5T1_9ZZZZ